MIKTLLPSLFCLFLSFPLQAEMPWGEDAKLLISSPSTKAPSPWYLNAIDFHQKVISKADGPRSHFFPGSSEYTRQAILKYGFFQGFLMGCDRLMRENNEDWDYPLTYWGKEWKKYDPVN